VRNTHTENATKRHGSRFIAHREPRHRNYSRRTDTFRSSFLPPDEPREEWSLEADITKIDILSSMKGGSLESDHGLPCSSRSTEFPKTSLCFSNFLSPFVSCLVSCRGRLFLLFRCVFASRNPLTAWARMGFAWARMGSHGPAWASHGLRMGFAWASHGLRMGSAWARMGPAKKWLAPTGPGRSGA
jgi:hypothetical protein